MTGGGQFPAQLKVIVDFTVEGYPDITRCVAHRLVTRSSQVNDGQPAVTQGKRAAGWRSCSAAGPGRTFRGGNRKKLKRRGRCGSGEDQAFAVRPAMAHEVRHFPGDRIQPGRGGGFVERNYATHDRDKSWPTKSRNLAWERSQHNTSAARCAACLA